MKNLTTKGHRFYIIWDTITNSAFTKIVRIITRSRIGNIIKKRLRRKTYHTGISRKNTRSIEVFKNVKSMIAARKILSKRNHKSIYQAIYFKDNEPEILKLRRN